MPRSWKIMVALWTVGVGIGGCAGPEQRPHHSVTISTEPAGAACLLTGGGEPIAELPATPAVARLPQSPRDVRVFCTSPGRAPTAAVLRAEADAAKLATLFAVGGLGGMAGAAMTGAGSRYAPDLSIAMPIMRFATTQERDGFFAARAAETQRHFDQPIRANKSMCRPDEFGCQHMITGMERARDEELARLEKLREATQPSP